MKKYILLSFFFYISLSSAQCFHKHVELQSTIGDATLIVEAQLTTQQGVRKEGINLIQTINTLQVSRLFKGSMTGSQIDFLTLGGNLALQFEHISTEIVLRKGQRGIFMLTLDSNGDYRIVDQGHGIIRYTQSEFKATRYNEVWNDIQAELYPQLTRMTSQNMQVKGTIDFQFTSDNRKAINNVNGLSPLTISAGSKSVLRITGSGFGNTQGTGTVEFRNVDDGGASRFSPIPNEFISWSDTQIEVEVPSGAGSGTVNVITDGGTVFTSNESIDIPFNHTNFIFTANNGEQFAAFANLSGQNGNNGYDFQYATSIDANVDAELTINDMYDKWRCTTGRNFVKIADLAPGDAANSRNEITDGSDGINVVKFDTGEIPGGSGTLAFLLSRGSGCVNASGGVDAYVTEMEFVINDQSNFHFRDTVTESLDNNEIDFESVVVHELGHAQQLGHVLDPNEVMFFSVSFGSQRRNISLDDQTGAAFINQNATQNSYCGQPSMTYADCDFVYDNGSWSPLDPSGTSNPVATATSLNGTAPITDFLVIEDLTSNAGSTLDVSGAFINVNGNITNNGSIIIDDVSMTGGNQNISGNPIDLNGLKISTSSTTTLNATSTLNELLQVEGTLNTNGNLTLTSNSTGTAIVDEITGTINGDVTVERFYPAQRAFRFISPTVNTANSIFDNWQEGGNFVAGLGAHVTGGAMANGFDQSGTNDASLFVYNNLGANGWTSVTSTNNAATDALSAGSAYRIFVRGDRSPRLLTNSNTPNDTRLRTTGTIEVGPSQNNMISPVEDAFSFVGNPLQAPIDMEVVLNRVGSNVNPSYYVWDATVGSVGAYVTVNTLSNTNSSPMTSPANKFAQPMQSYFVQTSTNAPAGLTYNEVDKRVGENNVAVNSTPTTMAHIYANLYEKQDFLDGGNGVDGLSLTFDPTFSNNADAYDSHKFDNITESISTVLNGQNYSIQQREIPLNNEIIQLNHTQYTHTTYIYSFNLGNLSSINSYLIDTYTGNSHILDNDATTTIEFTIDATIAASIDPFRFQLQFSDTTLSLEDNNVTSNLYPNPSQGSFHVVLRDSAFAKATIFNMLGQQVFEQKLENLNNILTTGLSSGNYLLRVEQNGNVQTHKLILR
jgi:hypothetical protein